MRLPGNPLYNYQRAPDPLAGLDPLVKSQVNSGRNIIPDPFAGMHDLLGIRQAPKQYATPEQERDVLNTLGRGAMSGLQYVGLGLDKALGARALRSAHKALASGKWQRDILSFLPFSDVLGITDPDDRVWSKDILTQHYGQWKDRPGKIDPVDLLGFGLDVATDPTLPFTGWFKGGLSAGGKAIKAAGALDDIDRVIARAATAAGTRVGKLAGRRGTTVKGAISMLGQTDAPLAARLSQSISPVQQAQKVGKSLEFGIPFTRMHTGVNVPGFDRARDIAFGAIRKSPLGTATQRFFNAKTSEMSTAVVQDLAKHVSHVVGRHYEEVEPALRRAAEVGMTGLDDVGNAQKLFTAMEATPNNLPAAMQSLSQGDREVVTVIRKYMEQSTKERFRYAAGSELADEFVGRFMHRTTRQSDKAPLAPGGIEQSLDALARDPHRASALKDFVGGTTGVIEVMKNPAVIAASKSSGQLGAVTQALEAAIRSEGLAGLMPMHLGGTIGGKIYQADPLKMQAFVKVMMATEDDVLKKGFYKHPLEGFVEYARKHRNRMGVASAQVDAIGIAQREAFRLGGKRATVVLKDVFAATQRGAGRYRDTAMKAHHPFSTNSKEAMKNPFGGGLYPEYIGRFGSGAQRAELSSLRQAWGQAASAADKVAVEALGTRLMDDIGKLTVDKRIIDDIMRWDLRPQATKAMSDLGKWYDSFTNMFKAGVLTWPARYTRDIVSGQVQNAFLNQWSLSASNDAMRFLTRGTVSNPKQYLAKLPRYAQNPAALRALSVSTANRELRAHIGSLQFMGAAHTPAAMIGTPKTHDTLRAMLEQLPGARPPGSLKTLQSEMAMAWQNKGAAAAPWNIRGVGFGREARLETQFLPQRMGDLASELTDGMNRLVPFFTLTKRGLSPSEITKRITASQVDYSPKALTSFERQVMSRVFPFYKFTRGMTPFVVSELLNRPSGMMAQSIRQLANLNRNEQFVPKHVQDTAAIPLTGMFAGKDPHRKRYLAGMGLMHEDPLQYIQPGQTWLGALQGLGKEIGGRVTPALKVPIETTFGEQLYSGRELEDLDPSLGRMISNIRETVTGEETEPVDTGILLEQALAATVPRFISSGRKLFDPGKGGMAKALNLLTGARISDIDYEKSKNIAIREAVAERERSNPLVHALRPRIYVRQEDRAKMDPWDLLLMDVDAQQRINWAKMKAMRE